MWQAGDRRHTIEVPSPGDVVGEGSSKQWTDNTRNTETRANGPLILRSLGQRHRASQQSNTAVHNTRAANTSTGNRSPDDECGGVGGSAAEDRSDFEDSDKSQEDVFRE